MAEPLGRPRLSIPSALTITVLGVTTLGCPAGDDGDTGNETSTQTGPGTTAGTEGPGTTQGTTTAATVGETTTAATEGSGTTAMTGLDTGNTTGEPLPDCTIYTDETSCEAEPLCLWNVDLECVLDCFIIDDQATCDSSGFCAWIDDMCIPPI